MRLDLIDVEMHGDEHLLATVDVTKPGEKTVRIAYIFPRDTLEWRAAEYGIDPADVETLLDIVLWEPHMEVAAEKHLYSAPTIAEARDHLLGEVSARKAQSEALRGPERASLARGRASVRERIVELSHLDPDVIRSKAEMVALHRDKSTKQHGSVSRQATAPSRVEKFQGLAKEMKQDATDAHNASRAR